MAATVRVGPAGWSYRDWAGVVYPPRPGRGFDPLAYLARYVATIEINSTFYRPARPQVAETWAARVADRPDFRFTAKLWRRFTHERDPAPTRAEVAQARAAFDVLRDADRLGAVLVQFPWSFRPTEENLAWLEEVLDRFADLPLVVEVRHRDWLAAEPWALLAERGVGVANIDQPALGGNLGPTARAIGPVAYVRIHGRNAADWWRPDAGMARYDYFYTPAELRPWAARVRALAAMPTVREVYVVTNNHPRGQGMANALMLASLLEGRRVPAPPPLLAAFADALAPFATPVPPEAAEPGASA